MDTGNSELTESSKLTIIIKNPTAKRPASGIIELTITPYNFNTSNLIQNYHQTLIYNVRTTNKLGGIRFTMGRTSSRTGTPVTKYSARDLNQEQINIFKETIFGPINITGLNTQGQEIIIPISAPSTLINYKDQESKELIDNMVNNLIDE